MDAFDYILYGFFFLHTTLMDLSVIIDTKLKVLIPDILIGMPSDLPAFCIEIHSVNCELITIHPRHPPQTDMVKNQKL